MGKRGPLPTPTVILDQRGSWRAKLNRNEPEPKPGAPRMPKTLDDEGRRVWRRIVPQLEAMGVLTHIDREKLERYCCLRSLFVKTLLFLAKAGDSRIVLSKDKKHIKSVTEYP